MKIDLFASDKAILHELGARIARHRLNKNMTQEALAQEAGLSLPTLQRIEHGQSTNIKNVLRILRALKLLDNLEIAVPPPPVSPLMQAKMQGKTRRRASSKTHPAKFEKKEVWSWGDQK